MRKADRAESEKFVFDDWAARASAQLILRVFLPEGRVRVIHKLEVWVTQRITECTLDVVCPASGSRRDLSPSELSARDIIGTGNDASIAHGFLGDAAGAEAQAVEREVVL